MKLGIFGCYNSVYFSDDFLFKAIKESINLYRSDIEVLPVTINTSPKVEYDALIIGGGTMLGKPLASLPNKPFAVFGCGYREKDNSDNKWNLKEQR